MSHSNQPSRKAPGEKLKEIRESKRLDLRSIHEQTKIPLDVLRAIEEGYTVGVISPFYLKGFTKMYAQYLGLDPDELKEKPQKVDFLAEQEEEKTLEPIVKEEQKRKIRFTANSAEDFMSRKRQKQIVQAIGISLFLFIVFKIGGCIKKNMPAGRKIATVEKKRAKINAKAQEEKQKIFEVKPKKDVKKLVDPKDKSNEAPRAETGVVKKGVKEKQKSEQKSAQKPEPKTEAKKRAPVAEKPKREEKKVKEAVAKKKKKVYLVIKSNRRGWLQVKADGKVVFQSTIKEGITEKWQAKEIIEISGKSIHYLEFEVNGKKLGGLSNLHKNARRVIITKDGLSVKQ